MISFLKGYIEEKSEKSIFLDVNGVGYEVYMPTGSASQLPSVGEKVKIHTYLQISENGIGLYGFLTKDELNVFKLLITVNGIGPKGAVGILSALTANELRLAVLADDDKAIAKAPGIGAKTAKKLILELKDKFHLEDALEEIAEPVQTTGRGKNEMGDAHAEAVQALVALGYSNSDALKAVRLADTGDNATTEDLLKSALKQLAFL
ncbi:MAG: Holliday junction branch migration protein RuvA [Lachnospiraceae bacterium]|nr:Holliday junction branch migration protein RuvA [Lachnospiraceae bacterium]